MAKDLIPSKYINWCCDRMQDAVYSLVYPVELELMTRTYCAPAMWPHGGRGLKFDYCPWCTKPLPDLEEKRWEILEKEYGVTRTEDPWAADPNIPGEFYYEKWWIERGL